MEKNVNLNNSSNLRLSKSLNGWNWGNIEIEEDSIKMTSDKEWFSIKGGNIANVTNPNKNEIGIELMIDEDQNEDA
jgi:hypothetical protein